MRSSPVIRQVALALAWAFSALAAALGLNALIKSNQDKSRLKRLAPPPVTRVDINTNDIFVAGTVATVAALLIAILTFIFVAGAALKPTRGLFNRTARLQGGILILASIFLFGSMVPYMVYFVNRSAVVTAFIGNTQLPDSLVQQTAKSAGQDGIYKHIHYLKLFAIFPWIALLFTLIAAAFLLLTPRSTSSSSSHGSSSPVMREKETIEHV
ncbi:hypothetical protein CPB83DRAFT_849051 [Crepidotus variabilis]|uniref:Uncharacterized protein n=1 Tax=Crepidotus variabilis TaxID=179855 RepID=A0A9P6EKI4_9AGAR|nr:hypothetical protein CPB83DRAFT_849051 [Crepidotus variabilis]